MPVISNPSSKILVTGGAGFIGSHVVDNYLSAGHQVVVMDDFSTGQKENLPEGIPVIDMDIRDPKVIEVFREHQIEVLNHHAAHIHVGRSVENPGFDADVNILGTLNLLQAAKEAGTLKKVIFASTGGAMYGDKKTPFDESMPPQPLSPYGISKRAAELYLYFYKVQYGINFTALRYANVYGPRQNPHGEAGVIAIFFNALKANKVPVINGDGLQTRDYVYVGDVAKANLKALEMEVTGEINVGTAIETDVNKIYQLVKNAAGSEIEATHGPARPGEQQTSSLNYNKAKELLNWQPLVTLEEGIQKTADYFLK